MTTGKTEEDPFWAELHKQAAAHPTEQARLEREVIEAAKVELRTFEALFTTSDKASPTVGASARHKLRKATRALMAFEAKQKK